MGARGRKRQDSSEPGRPSGRNLVFVYGTLREGSTNHEKYLHSAGSLGPGRTLERYALYVQGIPYVVKGRQISSIVGEIYDVDDNTLGRLDILEGHPRFYYREQVQVVLPNDSILTAWIYFHPTPVGEIVPGGDYFSTLQHT